MLIGHAGSLRYLVSVPAEPNDDEHPWPVLCFLHGYDEGVPLPLEQGVTRHGPLRRGSAELARGAFIVVAPQLPRAGDLWHRHAAHVVSIVRHVRREHRGDSHRVYLTGFSFGGNGVFDLAAVAPDEWAALWAVDPTRAPREPLKQPLWLCIGDAARWQRDSLVRHLALRDASALEANELAAGERFYVDGGHDHVGSATAAYRDERIYRWLLTKRRT